jgi:hypothetical protein
MVVDPIARDVDHACIDWNDSVWFNHHSVKSKLHPSLAHEVAGILVVFELADEIAVVGKNSPAVTQRVPEAAHNRIADRGVLRREPWLRKRATDHRPGWDEVLPCVRKERGRKEEGEDDERGAFHALPPGDRHTKAGQRIVFGWNFP